MNEIIAGNNYSELQSDIAKINKNTRSKEISLGIFEIKDFNLIKRNKNILNTNENIEKYQLFQEAFDRLGFIGGFTIPPWIITNNTKKKRLDIYIRKIEGITYMDMRNDVSKLKDNPILFQKIEQIFVGFIYYFIYCYKTHKSYMDDLKVEQFIFTKDTFEPVFIDLDPFTNFPQDFSYPLTEFRTLEQILMRILGQFITVYEELNKKFNTTDFAPNFGNQIFKLLENEFPDINWRDESTRDKFRFFESDKFRRSVSPDALFAEKSKRV